MTMKKVIIFLALISLLTALIPVMQGSATAEGVSQQEDFEVSRTIDGTDNTSSTPDTLTVTKTVVGENSGEVFSFKITPVPADGKYTVRELVNETSPGYSVGFSTPEPISIRTFFDALFMVLSGALLLSVALLVLFRFFVPRYKEAKIPETFDENDVVSDMPETSSLVLPNRKNLKNAHVDVIMLGEHSGKWIAFKEKSPLIEWFIPRDTEADALRDLELGRKGQYIRYVENET